MDEQLECALAQDLLVPFLAGEVRPETGRWLQEHLGRCDQCRAEWEQLARTDPGPRPWAPPVPPAVPPPEPGRRLLGRIRREVLIIGTALVLLVALAAGSLVWGITTFRKLAGIPDNMPVPTAMSPQQAATVDLSGLGLTLVESKPVGNGTASTYANPKGNFILLEARQYPSDAEATSALHDWQRTFHISSVVSSDWGGQSVVWLHAGKSYYYAWRRADWTILITIPNTVPEPTALRDQIRDRLMAIYGSAPTP